ncbi:MAG: hypothetical protein ACKVS8_08885 [Phycisphaerales bacterium]
MSFNAVLTEWIAAIERSTFLTPKHHPSSTGVAHSGYRSITVADASGLYEFFRAGQFSVQKYQNPNYPRTPDYYVIQPKDPAFVPGSGVESESLIASQSLDRFVVISGLKQGWHIHADSQSAVDGRVIGGQLSQASGWVQPLQGPLFC